MPISRTFVKVTIQSSTCLQHIIELQVNGYMCRLDGSAITTRERLEALTSINNASVGPYFRPVRAIPLLPIRFGFPQKFVHPRHKNIFHPKYGIPPDVKLELTELGPYSGPGREQSWTVHVGSSTRDSKYAIDSP
jgi:hypothetical protein